MLPPVRCFTCHKVLSNKTEAYQKLRKTYAESMHLEKKTVTVDDIRVSEADRAMIYFDQQNVNDQALKALGIERMCCRKMMLSYVDIFVN